METPTTRPTDYLWRRYAELRKGMNHARAADCLAAETYPTPAGLADPDWIQHRRDSRRRLESALGLSVAR